MKAGYKCPISFPQKTLFLMSVVSWCSACFVLFCVFLCGPFCQGAFKLDMSTLVTLLLL